MSRRSGRRRRAAVGPSGGCRQADAFGIDSGAHARRRPRKRQCVLPQEHPPRRTRRALRGSMKRLCHFFLDGMPSAQTLRVAVATRPRCGGKRIDGEMYRAVNVSPAQRCAKKCGNEQQSWVASPVGGPAGAAHPDASISATACRVNDTQVQPRQVGATHRISPERYGSLCSPLHETKRTHGGNNPRVRDAGRWFEWETKRWVFALGRASSSRMRGDITNER
jgi:hypothetical protein